MWNEADKPSKTSSSDEEGSKKSHCSILWLLLRPFVLHIRIVLSQSLVTKQVRNFHYKGQGTKEAPFVVDFIPDDPRNPKEFSSFKKWMITMLVAIATLAITFVSSAYSGGMSEMATALNVSIELATLGLSLFVLGFAIGPLLWAPLSELYGRQILFFITYGAMTAFNAGAAASTNIQTLLILRFFAGAFGSSILTNGGGVIADLFSAKQRGLAISIYASAPFLGPALGPIVGGFVGETIGWRWVLGIIAIFTGVVWILGFLLIPETYPPVLLRRRAAALSRAHRKVYLSKLEVERGKFSVIQAFKVNLLRPWLLLFLEPIVLLLSIYMAIIYGTLYMLFPALPIVFQEQRHWSSGIGGLVFIGVAVGMMIALIYTIFDNIRYKRTTNAHIAKGEMGAPPEARLIPSMVGAVCIPIGLFWFAWTNYTSIFWLVCVIALAPFGFGMVLVFLPVMNYLIDAYTIYAASALAANAVLRSLFGAAFPMFTSYMYDGLGIHWASSVPGFLALACVPFPFLFYKWGPYIRKKCKYAREAQEALKCLATQVPPEKQKTDQQESGGRESGTEEQTAEQIGQQEVDGGGESGTEEQTTDQEDVDSDSRTEEQTTEKQSQQDGDSDSEAVELESV
jgi:multidrug resistance protein